MSFGAPSGSLIADEDSEVNSSDGEMKSILLAKQLMREDFEAQ